MTKKLVPTPHDRFFRTSLSHPRVAREFLEVHLPEEIKKLVNLDTLEMRPGTFIDEELELHLTDVLFSVEWVGGKPGYLYTLLEHLRSPDPLMPFRKLQYTVKIMDEHYKMHKELPVVYTLVIYNGEKKYPYSTDLFDLFGEHKNLAKKTFLQPFDLVDLSQIPDADLKEKIWSGMMKLSLKHISERDLVPFVESTLKLIQQIEEEGGAGYIKTVFTYFFSVGEVLNKEALKHTIHNHLSPTLEKNIMTIGEMFKEEARKELRQEFEKNIAAQEFEKNIVIVQELLKRETQQKIAVRLLQTDMSDDEISAITDLPSRIIEYLRSEETVY